MKNKKYWILIALIVLAASVLFFLLTGSVKVSFFDFINKNLTPQQDLIVWQLRFPRIILALTVGAALAVSGVCQQAIFKNPLADPFILGISSGSALGAAIAIVFGYSNFIGFAAFLGGISTIFIVKGLDNKFSSSHSMTHLLLAGIAISALANACLSALMSIYSQQMQVIFFWIMGSVAIPPSNYITICSIIVACILVVFSYAKELDLISLGDEQAFFLGVEVKKVRNIILLLSAMITSLAVSMSGAIGFIGLIVPHLLRSVVGASHILLLPLSAILGGTFLLWADGLVRLTPWFSELPIGVVTAMFGAPFFLYILWTRGRQ